MSKPTELLEKAQHLAKEATTWAELSNALFNPVTGLLTRAYTTRAEREEFMNTPEYKEIRELLIKARKADRNRLGDAPTRANAFFRQFLPPAQEPPTPEQFIVPS